VFVKRQQEFRRLGGDLAGTLLETFSDEDVQRGLDQITAARLDAVVVSDAGGLIAKNRPIIRHLIATRTPGIFAWPLLAKLGALLAYGSAPGQGYPDMAERLDLVMNGVRPGDIPIAQPTRFVLALNLQTAKAMNLEMPQSLLAAADEVIE
jgi:putative ABC transport system substrate-binding protein